MTLPHHDTAERNEGRGGKAALLGAEYRGDRHVAAGLELAVGLEYHPGAQVVEDQGLVGFGDAEFPGKPSIPHTRQG